MRIVELSAAQWREAYPGDDDCIYRSPEWLDTIVEAYPHLAIRRLACVDSNDRQLWLLPLVGIRPLLSRTPMWISVAFGNYGGFIEREHLSDAERTDSFALLHRYFSQMDGSRIEIRGDRVGAPFVVNSYFRRFMLDLSIGESGLWDGINSNARSRVRKAERLGLRTAVDPPNADGIFQDLYEYQAKEHGTPIHAPAFFPALRRRLGGRAYVIAAFDGENPVGAILMLQGFSTTVLHSVLWRRGDLPVADLMYWAGIRECLNRRQKVLDFGRTRPVEGQLFFKRKWGAVEGDLPYSYLLKPGASIPLVVPEKGKFKLATRIWSQLPQPLLRRIGPILRVHIPT